MTIARRPTSATRSPALDREASLSLHEQIRRLILTEIWQGLYRPGDLLPSEKDLSERFGVNRLTVRQALHALVNQGHARSLQGRGYQVRPPVLSTDVLTVVSFSHYLEEIGVDVETKLLGTSTVSAEPEVAEALGIHPGNEVIKITRQRFVLDAPIAVEEAYYDAQKFEAFLKMKLDHISLIDTLFHVFDLRIGRVATELQAELAGQRAEFLRVSPDTPILLASTVMYDLDDKPVELGLAYYHGERVKLALTSPVDPGSWPYGVGSGPVNVVET